MSRLGSNILDGLAAGLLPVALVAIPTAANADVLEISANGHAWIARASNAATATTATDQEFAVSSSEIGPVHSIPVTSVSDTAGPDTWRAHVGALATKYDLSPALIEALVWQESRWRINAVSPVGARGLAQLMPGTARQLGVDPSDPHANLEGGARYLRMQLDAFDGDIEKALAAYNAGPGRVQRARGIPRIRETQNYVTAILGRLSAPVRR